MSGDREERRTTPDRRSVARGGRRYADHAGRPVVLIVDDHDDSRELVATVLQELNVVTAEAATGEAAIARAAAEPHPRLVLIDLSLPDCHGTEVVRALKGDPRTAQVPVIAVSAAVLAADKEGAAAAGCAGFIEKPLSPAAVVEVVRRLLADPGP